MKKTTLWALALAIAGTIVVSCDSTSSPPPSDTDTDTTSAGTGSTGSGTGTQTQAITMVNVVERDTTVDNDVTSLLLRFKTEYTSGVVARVNGATATLTSGVYSYRLGNLAVGINTIKITATGLTDTFQVRVTRRLGTPSLVAVGSTADQFDFTDSAVIRFTAADNQTTDSIRYSTAGSTAKISTADPKVRSGATRTIKGTTTFRAIAIRRTTAGLAYSDTVTVTFNIGKTLGKPYFSTNRVDSFTTQTKIGIGGYGVGDTVRYTTNGGDPNRDSRIYSNTDSILIQDSVMVIAKSFNGINQSSPTCTTTIKLKALDPVFSVKSGTYTSQRLVNIKSPSGVPVYYTTDGSTPTNASLKAGDSLYIDSNVTVKAFAFLPGWRASKVVSATYKFKVATPTLSFRTGNYDTTQYLSITDSAEGADIRYTVNGSTPNCGSTRYNADSLLKLDSNVVVKAIACKTGWDSSEIATGNYTFKVANIHFAPDSGIYRDFQWVKLTTRSPGVTFFVTRDSSTPAWNSSYEPQGATQKKLPGDTLFVNKSQWIRIIAVRQGWANSMADSRRYIVEGDTLLVDDFEQNSLTRKIGYDWRFWACGHCVNTGIPNQMEANVTDTTTDWNRQIGFRHGKIDFQIPDFGLQPSSDGGVGSGYAGYSVAVPPDMMGETYRLVFWARWKKGPSAPDSLPMITEMVWKKNDNQNGGYKDGFHRRIDWVGPQWRRFILDYSAFGPASNAYVGTTVLDSAETKPKDYWIISGRNYSNFGDSARMIEMGLPKFEGTIGHHPNWKPKWVWDADHDAWVKNDITNFRWSIIQPYTNKSLLADLTHGEYVVDGYKFISDTVSITDSLGTGETVITRMVPDTVYCGDCHKPTMPALPGSLLQSLVKNLSGSLQLDRIQLVRRPQRSGGATEAVKGNE
ncbi:MAG TPA: chitobiase/beta-hexosaminidase C-terminal domain-containing protein [Fibrobacteria bacterium]|nr:chitobiase/beta-hexosaminidase C-terminal domain-containing protein [Fibrobacteria bacterium]